MMRLLIVLHLLGSAVWVGGHLVLATVILPRALKRRDPAYLLAFESSFERIGIPALILQVLTGLELARRWVPMSLWFSPSPPQGWLVLTKLGLLAATLGLALHARLRLIPRLRPESLPVLAAHIVTVTVLAVAFLVCGVGIRTGGLF